MKKRLISFLLTVVMLVSLCTAFGTSASADSNVIPVPVADGDTVLKLCQRLGVDFYTHKNLINTLNGFTSEADYRRLTVGDYVMLPANEVAAAALEGSGASAIPLAAGGTTAAGMTPAGTTPAGQTTALPAGDHVAYYLVWYTVQRGQTIDSIYRDWGLNYRTYDNQIRKLNNITSYTNLAAQKTYLLPTTNPAVANSAYYTVMAHTMRSGENAYDIITSQYGLNFGQVQQMTLSLNNTSDLAYIGANTTLYIPVSGIVSPSTTVSPTTAAVTTTATVSTSANYNLVSQTSVNGNFALMVDGKVATTAQAGKVVSVIATPDTGYGLDMIRVTKVGDANSAVAVNNSSFIMPNYSVIVSVTFKSVPAYTITVDSNKNGSVAAMVDGTSVTKGYLGSKISVRAIPKAGFMLDTIRVTYNNYKDSVAVENNVFVMPATNVTVTANFVADPNYDPNKGNLIFVDENNCKVTASVGDKEVQYAKKGDIVALKIVPNEGYTITSVKVYSSDFSKLVAVDKFGFSMPDSSVNVVVDAKPTVSASFPINIVDPINGEVFVTVDDAKVKSAIVGETVTVHGKESKPAYNYVTTVYKTDDPSVSVPVEQNSDGTVNFVMPDFEVTVRVKFYTYYSVRTHASNGQFGTYGIVWNANQNVSVSKAGAGVELKVGFSYIAPGYSVSEIMLIYADGSTYTLDGTSFIMPDCDVTVKVNFAKSTKVRAFSITENDTDKANVYPHWGNTYTVGGKTLNDLKAYNIDIAVASGSNVTVTPSTAIGYKFDKFVINYKDSLGNFKSETFTYLDKNPTTLKYQFQMPSDLMAGGVVELRVYFKEVKTYSLTPDYINACDPAGNVDNSNADHHMGTFGFMTVYDKCDHAAEDTKLYIRSFANPGYHADLSGVKIYRDNKDGTFTDVTADPNVNYDPTNYSFFMPTYDLRIYVPFTESMFWVNLEKSFDAAMGLARGEITLVVGDVHFTEETLTLKGSDKNNTRKLFDPGTLMKIVNTSNTGYFLDSAAPFSIYRVDKNGNYASADLAGSLMIDGSLNTFVMPAFNISIKANYSDEVVIINKAPCEHGSFTVPSQVSWNAPFDITEIYPDEGFELSKILLTYTDFNGTPHKEESIDISSVSGSSKTIQLVGGGKPQGDVTVKVVFTSVKNALKINYKFSGTPVEIVDYYNVDLDVLEVGSIEIDRDTTTAWSSGARTDSVVEDKGIPTGSYVRLGRSYLHYDANFNISGVSVVNNGYPVEVTAQDGYYYFYMPYVSEGECIITVNYTNLDEYSFYLSDKATGDGEVKNVTFKVSGADATTAHPGDEISVYGDFGAVPAGKNLKVYAIYTDSDNVTHRVKAAEDTDHWTFKVASMPVPATVAIEYAFESAAHKITDARVEGSQSEFWVDGEQVVADASGELKVSAGKTVTVKPIIGSVPAGKVAVGISTDVPASIEGYTFVMPDSDVAVSLTLSEALTVSIDPAVVSDLVAHADYTITTSLGTRTNESQLAYNNETVRLAIMPKAGYKLTSTPTASGASVTPVAGKDNEFDITLGTSSVILNGFEFRKQEQKVTIHYTADSAYTLCSYEKNGAPFTSGETIGVNDVLSIKDYDGYKIVTTVVKYLDENNAVGTSTIDMNSGTIALTAVPATEIDIELKLEKVITAFNFTWKQATDNETSFAVTNGAMSAAGQIKADTTVGFSLKVRYDVVLDTDSVTLNYTDAAGNPQSVPLSFFGGSISKASDLSDNKGYVRVYNGSFKMPSADTSLDFAVKPTTKFSFVKNGNAVYSDAACTAAIDTGNTSDPFYVVAPAVAGKYVSEIKATYYVYNSEKPDGDTVTVNGTDIGGGVFSVSVTEPSMYNRVSIDAIYAANP